MSWAGKRIFIVTVVALVFCVDQASKAIALHYLALPPGRIGVGPFLSLRLGFNTGISFGLFQETFADQPSLLIVLKLCIVIFLLYLALISTSRSEAAGLSMIIGGACGNILDRARSGAVTDFLDLHWQGMHWPTFNLADVAICLGVALMLRMPIFSREPQT